VRPEQNKLKNRHITPEYFTLTELSVYSGLGRRFLRDAIKSRERPLPHFRITGKTILVSKDEFGEWLKNFRTENDELERIVNQTLWGMRK
jgi:excisionase family DNA binding protein